MNFVITLILHWFGTGGQVRSDSEMTASQDAICLSALEEIEKENDRLEVALVACTNLYLKHRKCLQLQKKGLKGFNINAAL